MHRHAVELDVSGMMDKFCGNCKHYAIGPHGAFCDCAACDARGEIVSPFEYRGECGQWEKAEGMAADDLRRRMLAMGHGGH